MAHLIKLNQLDLNHDNTRTYIPILFNLDRAISMEPSVSGKHTAIITAHAFQYFSLTGLSVHRTQPQRFGAWHRYLLYFGGSSVVAIVFYAYTIDSALNPAGLFSDYLAVGLRALFFTVTFSHYLIDGVIWRHRHWENSLVYTRV